MEDSSSQGKKPHDSTETEYVVRSERDNGMPGIRFDDDGDAWARAEELNEKPGLPDDHTVHEEEPL